MKPWPLLVIGLGTILSLSCSKGQFTEDKTTAETYEIKVVDPSGDATAAPGETTASVEGPDAGTDTADAGGKGSGPETESGKGEGKSDDKGKAPGKGGDVEAGDCAAASGINKDRVKVSGNQKSLTMSPQDAFALKVTGNQNSVNLKMSGDIPGTRVAAICLFLAGNQSHLTMDIGVKVGKIYVKARGNKALVEASVSKDGVIENLQVDANGNEPSIVMKGEGSYPCDQAAVSCQKP